MWFADAHSDIGVLIHLTREGLMPRNLVDTYFEQLKQGNVLLSIIQLGGDFEHLGVDLRESESVLAVLESITREVKTDEGLHIVASASELEEFNVGRPQTRFILSLEGCAPIDPHFQVLESLYEGGLRALALTHNGRNIYASGCAVENDTGLTRDGERLLDRAAELGLILDLVHIGEKSFWDAIEYSSTPVYISHSNSKRQYDHMRNITDEQIQAVAERDGVVALNFLSEFIDNPSKPVSLERWVDHLEHMVNLASIRNVALGPDFFRYMMPELDYVGGVDNPSALPLIAEALGARGYSEDEIELVGHGNLLRFLEGALD
ncbi:hypothetical protein EU524_01170 [Candidatus Thorarchaeota archaeon]|nr:MAG: hypothetical protein EU524_01170 [Candidatus Thorarchaeota archaeon]